MHGEGAERILNISRENVAPKAVDFISQEAVRFLQGERTDQTTDGFLTEWELLQRKAESGIQMGGAYP